MKNNHYISRYEKGETRFHRTDPFKSNQWDFEEKEMHILLKLFYGCGFALSLILIVIYL